MQWPQYSWGRSPTGWGGSYWTEVPIGRASKVIHCIFSHLPHLKWRKTTFLVHYSISVGPYGPCRPKKSSKSWSVEWERINIAESRKDFLIPCVLSGFPGHRLQTKDEKSQLRRAWSMLSDSLPQTRQSLLWDIPLQKMASIEGRPLTHALQAKTLIFAGRLRCQSFLHNGLQGSPLDLSLISFVSSKLWAMW